VKVWPDIVARALRTLVISDLHLGNWGRHDVLRLPGPRAKLLDALEDFDRLVLLGDLAELATRHSRRALEVAEPVLREIGRRLGPEREAIVVPGNHDGPLIHAWVGAQGSQLTLDAPVPLQASRALDRLVSWLSPARVQVRYPGIWLADRVWATHGHYLDRHLVPESPFGLLERAARDRDDPSERPVDYERWRSRSRWARPPLVARLRRRPAATVLQGISQMVRVAALPALPQLLMQARLSSVSAATIDVQMRYATIPAMARVVHRLGVQADWVVFGHVHRLGPLAGESLDRWRPSDGSPRFINTGSWLYEPLLIDRARPPHPYWPGGAVILEPGREPRATGLLDELSIDDMRARR
jgi:UDP-2,3-diacylglucosamine pyrophosphatase LpxH